jgi:hypothetical protein
MAGIELCKFRHGLGFYIRILPRAVNIHIFVLKYLVQIQIIQDQFKISERGKWNNHQMLCVYSSRMVKNYRTCPIRIEIIHEISSPFLFLATATMLVGCRDCRTQFWKEITNGPFPQSLVFSGQVASENIFSNCEPGIELCKFTHGLGLYIRRSYPSLSLGVKLEYEGPAHV